MGRKTIVLFHHNKKRFPKSHVVYRGVNIEKFKPLGKKREYLGFMNKFSEQVDSRKYEKIAKKIGLKSIYSGEKNKEDNQIKRTLALENKHTFNKIPEEKMNEFYNKCKIFINLTTPDAGFNLSWLEAMAAGVPIIIGNNNGAGPMFPFDKIFSLESLEEELKKILKHPKKINYREWIVENKLTWDKVAENLIEIFENGRKNS